MRIKNYLIQTISDIRPITEDDDCIAVVTGANPIALFAQMMDLTTGESITLNSAGTTVTYLILEVF